MSKVIKKTGTVILFFFFCLLGLSIVWCLMTFQRLNMDELVYELSQPLQGTGSDMLSSYFARCLIPAVLLTVIFVGLFFLYVKYSSKRFAAAQKILLLMSFLFALVSGIVFCIKLEVIDYLVNSGIDSTFIEDNYVDPKSVNVQFSENKRNLIYIYLESMEVTYTDESYGGAFDYNCIPELAELSRESECFSADDKLNGGYVLPGTTWTMGGMFAQTSGLPLKIGIADNMMDTQDSFFSGATVLGDILEKEGYNQELLIGSDATFGGRRLYFTEHGNYEMHDYIYAIDEGLIPGDYKVFWGYEDEKLFENAKADLTELSSKGEPFNLTMLTVDTHFPEGYACELCRNDYDSQYANAMACSSRQVTNFVNWIKEQDFYENTTIIISGDHTTMSERFVVNVPRQYDRKTYTAIINPAVSKVREGESIQFSTIDMFPTTLAAIGAEIEGNRLGIGTNLFSGEKTIVEQYGLEHVSKELNKSSKLMDELGNVVITEEMLREMRALPDADINVISYDAEKNTITVKVDNIINADEFMSIVLSLYDEDMKMIRKANAVLQDDRSYIAEVDLNGVDVKKGIIKVVARGKEDIELGQLDGDLTLAAHDTLADYIGLFKERENYALIFAGQGDCTYFPNLKDLEALKSLGIMENLERDNCSFYAVVDYPSLIHETSGDALSIDGVLIGDSTPFHIESANSDAGEYSSIMIDGVEYSKGGEGINVVAYDYNTGSVIDTACFNMFDFAGAHELCHVVADTEGDTLHLSVPYMRSGRLSHFERTTLRGVIWDSKHKKKPIAFDFDRDYDDKTGLGYYADIKLKHYDLSDIYLEVFVFDKTSQKENKDFDWHGDVNLLSCDFADYLQRLSGDLDKYSVILAVKNDALSGIDDDVASLLTSMGLSQFEESEERIPYFAVIDGDYVEEEKGSEYVSYEGVIGDATVSVESGIADYGDYASITINGVNYAKNYKGLNIVVYDKKSNRVVDSVAFDLTSEVKTTIR